MELALLILASSTCIVVTELLKRKFSLPASLTRRVVHVVTAVVAAIAPLFVGKEEIIIISLIFAVGLFWSRSRKLLSSIHSVERKTFGEVWLPVGVAATAFLFLPNSIPAFQFGVLIMGISDPLAGFIGELIGKHRFGLFGSVKSIEGSIAFFLSSSILTFLFFPKVGYELFLIPAVLTITELLLVYGLDNLVLPLVGAACMQILLGLALF